MDRGQHLGAPQQLISPGHELPRSPPLRLAGCCDEEACVLEAAAHRRLCRWDRCGVHEHLRHSHHVSRCYCLDFCFGLPNRMLNPTIGPQTLIPLFGYFGSDK